MGVDTFWYGADFPGETLEYVVIVRLPFGVPDRYHKAQCASLGQKQQREQIYMPRSLAKFRQGFGRLMRRETDRGCVFVLDKRVNDPRHRAFLRELPIKTAPNPDEAGLARMMTGSTDACIEAALDHMQLGASVEERGLKRSFEGWQLDQAGTKQPVVDPPPTARDATAQAAWGEANQAAPRSTPPERLEIDEDSLPF